MFRSHIFVEDFFGGLTLQSSIVLEQVLEFFQVANIFLKFTEGSVVIEVKLLISPERPPDDLPRLLRRPNPR